MTAATLRDIFAQATSCRRKSAEYRSRTGRGNEVGVSRFGRCSANQPQQNTVVFPLSLQAASRRSHLQTAPFDLISAS